MSVISKLQTLQEKGEQWRWKIKASEDGRVRVLWWMSPQQLTLARQFPDLLLNDNTYCRNQYGYPLNIGIIIDGLGMSRNVFYALQADETYLSHEVVFDWYREVIGTRLELLATDRHPSLIKAAAKVFPTANHIYCLWHLKTNVADNLRPRLGLARFNLFVTDFFAVYYSISPDRFDANWQALMVKYPECSDYLNANIYPCRDRWAWTFISQLFTGGIRTTGRIEAENRFNKAVCGPKTTFTALFDTLYLRAVEQAENELIAIRQVSFNHYLLSISFHSKSRIITLLDVKPSAGSGHRINFPRGLEASPPALWTVRLVTDIPGAREIGFLLSRCTCSPPWRVLGVFSTHGQAPVST
jgi:hypothetical protein